MGCNGSKDVADPATSPSKDALLNESTTGAPSVDDMEKGGMLEKRRPSIMHMAAEITSAVGETPYDKALIGTLTRHGIAPGRAGTMSKAKINQDRGIVCWPFNGTHNQALFCVFDGHGGNGERVSEWCVQQIPQRLEADRDALFSETEKCLSRNVRAFAQAPMAPLQPCTQQ